MLRPILGVLSSALSLVGATNERPLDWLIANGLANDTTDWDKVAAVGHDLSSDAKGRLLRSWMCRPLVQICHR